MPTVKDPDQRLVLFCVILALAAYAAFIVRNLSYAIGGPDTGGYMNEARMIADGRMTLPVDLVRTLKLDDSWLRFFMPLGFAPSPGGRMHPTYPPGLPMHLAIAGLAGGWRHSPFFVVPLAAVGSLALLFGIARKLELPLPLAVAAPAILGSLPPFLWHAVQPASDVLATFWALAAMYCCLKGAERQWIPFVAGLAFAIGVWVRPSNILLVFACVLALRCRPRPLLQAAAGALPVALALMWWNSVEYGSALQTGYGDVIGNLSWEGVKNAGPQYVRFLAEMLTPAVFPLGFVVLFDRRADFLTRWMLVAWFVPFFVFYCFYGFFDGWLCVRFVLPAIPALILGSLIVIRDLRRALSRFHHAASYALAAALVIWMCITPMRATKALQVLDALPHMEQGYPRYVQWAEQHLPKRSIVITGVLSGPFLYYAHRGIARYDQLNDQDFQLLRAYAGNAGLPWYAVVDDSEIEHADLEKRLKGTWTAMARLNSVTIYRLDS